MSLTNADIISQIRTSVKAVQDDTLLPDRQIYRIAKSQGALLIRRELNARKLLTSDNIFQSYECLDLILVDGTECDCSMKVRRSRDPLPQIEEGLYSYFIQGVFNVNNSAEIFPTTIREFINLSKLRIQGNKTYYLIKNGYLYILSPDVEKVNIYAYFTETINCSPCQSMYEREFKFPPYLLSPLFNMCTQELLVRYKIPKDNEDNNREEP
jgi:hypothetical protein